jgi:ABC-type glycerol-3-phosphate transport system substrate-binding protein
MVLPKQFRLLSFFFLLLLLSSCSNTRGNVVIVSEDAMITLAVPDGIIERYRVLAEAFMADNEGVTVHVESMDRLIGSDPNPAHALAQSADLFPSGTAFAGDWQALTLNLTPLANAANFDAHDFPVGLLYAADDTIRHLPVTVYPSLVLYNKAHFDVAGLAYPAPDWTWEEFVSLATRLTQRYGDFTAQYGWADGLNTHALVAAGLAGHLVDYTNTPPTPRLTEEEVVEAVARYVSLYSGDKNVAPVPRSAFSASSETQTLIRERRVAIWLGNYNDLGSYSEQDIGVLSLPVINGREDRRLYVFSRGFAVSAATQQPQAAWQLLEYLSRQPDLDENAMPARASVRQATGFWENVDPQIANLIEKELVNSFELANAPASHALTQAVTAILLEDISVIEALAREEAKLEQVLAGQIEPLEPLSSSHGIEERGGQILFVTNSMHYHRHQALAQAFAEENPDFSVEIAPPRWTFIHGAMFRTMDQAYGHRQADCFIYEPLHSPVEAARVLDLDALLELDPNIDRDTFYPVALSAFVNEGALLALPNQFALPLIGYDTLLFDRANINYPEAGWTLDDFLDTAVALSTGENSQKQYGYVPHQGDFHDALTFLYAFGVDLLDRTVDPPTARFDTPTVANALAWYVALSETYGVKPVYGTNSYDVSTVGSGMQTLAERRNLFANRRGAMWRDDGSEWEGAYATPTAAIEERQYTTFPIASAGEVVLPLDVTGLYISAKTEQRQACWQWITFLSEHDPGVGIPARISVAHSEEFQLRAGPAAAIMLQNVEQTSQRQIMSVPEWMNLRGWYSIALTRTLEEEITAAAALAATQVEFESYRHCVIERELFQPEHWGRRLVECADPASPYVILGVE